MNNLKLNVSVPSLSQLTPISANTYAFYVRMFAENGSPLVNANIPPSPYYKAVQTSSTSFQINIPITNATFTIPNVKFMVYANQDLGCCFASIVATISNTQTIVTQDGVILNNLMNSKIYAYEPDTKVLTELFEANDSFDVAHTATRLWVYSYMGKIYEYGITLSPFTHTPLRSFDINPNYVGAGLCAESNNRIYIAGEQMTQLDISGSTPTQTVLFNLPEGFVCTGDMAYDTTSQLFLMSYHNSEISQYKIGVFNRSGTILRSANAPTQDIFGIFQFEGLTYIVASQGQIYTINLTTLATSLSDTIGVQFAGASQIPSKISIPS